jgi:hypothetical protein
MQGFARRRRAYLFLLNSLRLPRSVATSLVKGAARVLNPRRRRQGKNIAPKLERAISISEDKGFRFFGPGEIDGVESLVNACRALFEEAKASSVLADQVRGKPFLVPVAARQQDLMAIPEVRDFVLSPQIVDTAIKYFGEVPILSDMLLLWSPPNDTNVKSQQYHFDAEDYRQLKVFVNIFDTTVECGPLTLIGSTASAKVARRAQYAGGRRSRLADESIEDVTPRDDIVAAIGPAGSGIFVDTSRCLHYGSRGNKKERLVLLIQFMSFYAPKMEPVDWSPIVSSMSTRLDPVRKLMLQV